MAGWPRTSEVASISLMQNLKIGSAELGVLARMVRKADFFTPLTVSQLDQVLPHIRLHSFDAGETVFRQGAAGDALYIVYKGSVEVRLKRFLLLYKTAATLSPGDFFGEIALISAEPRTATVVTVEPTLLFTLISTDFRFILKGNPSLAREMKRLGDRRKFDSSHID